MIDSRPPTKYSGHALWAYGDILGYKNLLSSHTVLSPNAQAQSFNELSSKIQSLSKRAAKASKLDYDISFIPLPKSFFRMFADSILLGTPISKEYWMSLVEKTQWHDMNLADGYYDGWVSQTLQITFTRISLLCENCISTGFLLRGGISDGQMGWSPDYTFGHPMMHAYELERNVAKMPCFAISPKTVSLYLQCAHYDETYEADFFLLTDGKTIFVNPYYVTFSPAISLSLYITELDEIAESVNTSSLNQVKKLKNSLTMLLESASGSESYFDKITWACDLYNWHLKEIKLGIERHLESYGHLHLGRRGTTHMKTLRSAKTKLESLHIIVPSSTSPTLFRTLIKDTTTKRSDIFSN